MVCSANLAEQFVHSFAGNLSPGKTLRVTIREVVVLVLPPRHGPHHQKRLCAFRNRIRQRSVRRLVREIF